MRGALLRLPDLDAHLAAAIAGRSPGATELAVHLLKAAVQDADPPLAGSDLPASVDVSISIPTAPFAAVRPVDVTAGWTCTVCSKAPSTVLPILAAFRMFALSACCGQCLHARD